MADENIQTIPRTLTLGENKPVMFTRGNGDYEGWILELRTPYNYWATVRPPDSGGWSLDVDPEKTTATIGCNTGRDHVKVTWVGDPEGEASFHTWIYGDMYPCGGSGGSDGTYDPEFSLEIKDGLVFLVEEVSSTGIGKAVKIGAYRRETDTYGEVTLVPVQVNWGCLDTELVFLESVESEEPGVTEPGEPLDSENMFQSEVWVVSNVQDTYTVTAGVEAIEESDYSHPAYELVAIVHVYDVALVVDANRDLKIDARDLDIITEDNPWRFWLNNDYDFKAPDAVSEFNTHSDKTDYSIYLESGKTINVSVRDLTDFYPLMIDIKRHIDKTMEHGQLTHLYTIQTVNLRDSLLAPSTTGIVLFTNILPSESGKYITDVGTAEKLGEIEINDQYRAQNSLYPGTIRINQPQRSNGVIGDFIENIISGSAGVMLVSHYSNAASFDETAVQLKVQNESLDIIVVRKIPISVYNVETMFSHIDLTGEVNGDQNYISKSRYVDSEPLNYPDELTNDTRFVFVHGYNNNMRASFGANAENFKRLHLLGSQAKYIAVSWFGWQSQFGNIEWEWLGYKCPEYQLNVINAFRTAPHFANALGISSLQKTRTVVAAHSLGNMVVSSAIEDWNPSENLVDRYIMLNAAVSQEAYGFDEGYEVDRDMIPVAWTDFVRIDPTNPVIEQYAKLFAFNWHRNSSFSPDDSRRLLTWSNRFGSITARADVTNLWSKGDRTFYSHPHHSWVFSDAWQGFSKGLQAFSRQEKRKGTGGLSSDAGLFSFSNDNVGGWAFNQEYNWTTQPQNIPELDLIEKPYFRIGQLRNGLHSGDYLIKYDELFDVENDESADDAGFRNTLLAVMIPSRLNGMGRALETPVGFKERENIEMQEEFQNNGEWPIDSYDGGFWDHGHFQVIALPYVYKLYDFIVQDLD